MSTKTVHSLDSEIDSESCGRTTKPNTSKGVGEPTEVAVEPVTTRGTKRKSTTDHFLFPKKKLSGPGRDADSSEPTEVPVEGATAKGTKRKASTETVTPGKKQRVANSDTDTGNTGEPTKVSVEDKAELKEASAGQLPATETPGTSGCDLSPSSSSPSTSSQSSGSTSCSAKTSRDAFEAEYLELHKLGEGGFGSVYAGQRKSDNLPVAIKHIPKEDVEIQPVVSRGEIHMVPLEVILMVTAAGDAESVGESAAVSLLNWYDLDQEVLLVMERPVPSVDLNSYVNDNGPLEEAQAKNIMKQLVEAAIKMHAHGVFHRDIKTENVLVETGSNVPRVRVIDFGCGCLVTNSPYRCLSGTSAFAPPELFTQGEYEAGPTTVWQLGALLYELLDEYQQFATSMFLCSTFELDEEIRAFKVTKDCQDFLKACLVLNPRERATLEQIQLHPWLM